LVFLLIGSHRFPFHDTNTLPNSTIELRNLSSVILTVVSVIFLVIVVLVFLLIGSHRFPFRDTNTLPNFYRYSSHRTKYSTTELRNLSSVILTVVSVTFLAIVVLVFLLIGSHRFPFCDTNTLPM
jgi:high-affinity nickel permease